MTGKKTGVGRSDQPVEPVSPDSVLRFFDNEAVAWGPGQPRPVYLDPVAAIVVQMLDGNASIGELADDVHAVVGVPTDIAKDQIKRSVALLRGAGVLEGASTAGVATGDEDIFRDPPNP